MLLSKSVLIKVKSEYPTPLPSFPQPEMFLIVPNSKFFKPSEAQPLLKVVPVDLGIQSKLITRTV